MQRHALAGCVGAFALGAVLRDSLGPEGAAAVRAAGLGIGGVAAIVGACVPRGRGPAALALAALAGLLSLDARIRSAEEGWREDAGGGRVLEGSIAAVEPGRHGARVALARVRAADGGASLPTRLRLHVDTERVRELTPRLRPGERVRLRARVRGVRPPGNPGQPDRARAARHRGDGAEAWLGPTDPVVAVGEAPRPTFPGREDSRGRRAVAARLGSDPPGGLLRALALGDRAALPHDVGATFARLGVAHLLAVSGLHLGLVAVAALALGRRVVAWIPRLAASAYARWIARGLALGAAGTYAVVTGLGVPVQRAWAFVATATLALGAGRRLPRLQAWVWAAALVLLAQPVALFGPGPQLSFVACGALLLARSDGRHDGWRGVAGASAIAGAATAPLVAWHWGIAAPFAWALNALAVPWTAGVLLPAAFLAVGAVAWLPEGVADPSVAVARALAEWSLAAGTAADRALPARPAAPVPVWAILAACGLAVATIAVRRLEGRVLLALATGGLLGLAPIAGAREAWLPRVVVLDVGRGDAVLVQGRQGALLFDGGAALSGRFDRGAQVVVPALRALGVVRLDLVIASHADLDHRGGLPAVLRALPVGELWLPFGAAAEADFADLRAVARDRGVPVREQGRGRVARRFGDLAVHPLWPPLGAGGSRNESSLGVAVEAAGRRVLLLGDLGAREADLLDGHAPETLASDVLVLPHHGSRGSSSAALLDGVGAEVHIVSAPCPAQRGLPHAEVLDRLARRRRTLWWTGRDGAVTVRLDADLGAFGHRGGSPDVPEDPTQSASCSTSRS